MADLNRPANAPFGSDSHPVGTFRVFNPDPNSCTWSSSGSLTIPSTESPIVPGDGTVTTVRVKTGPVLPHRGREPVSLRVQNNNAGAINTLDSLGLSVLAPRVRIPAYYDGANDLTSTVFSPAVQVGTQNVNRNGSSGAKLLINADWIPVGAARPIGLRYPRGDRACRGGQAGRVRLGAVQARRRREGSGKVKLSKRGRTLVRNRKRPKVRLEVDSRAEGRSCARSPKAARLAGASLDSMG